MRAGRNRWRVTLQAKGAPSYSALGEEATTYTAVGSYWAHKFVKSAREELSQGIETAQTLTRFMIRTPRSVNVNPEMRLIWVDNLDNTHTYNIREVLPTGPGDSELLLTCTEVLDG